MLNATFASLNQMDLSEISFANLRLTTPKGFKYTQTNDRMWRKNRQTTNGSNCLGHDINRNWPYKWDVEGGASKNPCAEDFKGTAAGDAPETKALSEFLRKVKAEQGLKLYIDYHSYSQLVMTREFHDCQHHQSRLLFSSVMPPRHLFHSFEHALRETKLTWRRPLFLQLTDTPVPPGPPTMTHYRLWPRAPWTPFMQSIMSSSDTGQSARPYTKRAVAVSTMWRMWSRQSTRLRRN